MQLSGRLLACREATLRFLTPRWMMWGLSLLILNQLALLSWRSWLADDIYHVDLAKAKANPAPAKPDRGIAAENDRFTLFGTSSPASSASGRSVSDNILRHAPPSSLKLRLAGVVVSSDPKNSMAIIAKDSKQLTLFAGDSLPGYSAKIMSILSDRIVISYQGRYESLLFNEQSEAGRSINKSSVAQIKTRLQKHPQNILDYIKVAPVMVENKLAGYRLNAGKNRDLFYQSGLQDNDLAIVLNGMDLRDTQQAQQALKQLAELSELNLTVERDGKRQNIYFVPGDD